MKTNAPNSVVTLFKDLVQLARNGYGTVDMQGRGGVDEDEYIPYTTVGTHYTTRRSYVEMARKGSSDLKGGPRS